MIYTDCPICESPPRKPIYELRNYTFLICSKCQHIYENLMDSLGTVIGSNPTSDFMQTYSIDQFIEYYQPLRRKQYRKMLNRLCSFVPRGNLLDIGCSFGWLLDEAEQLGFNSFGIEPSKSTIETANLDPNRVICAGIDDLPDVPWNEFDVIVLWHVMEHLENPKKVLELVVSKLKPDGTIVVNVPNAEGFIYRLTYWLYKLTLGQINTPLEEMFLIHNPNHHLHYFNPQSLLELTKHCSLKILDLWFDSAFDAKSVTTRLEWTKKSPQLANKLIAKTLGGMQSMAAHFNWLDNVIVFSQQMNRNISIK